MDQFADVLRFLNETATAEELSKKIKLSADTAASLMAQKSAAGGMLTSVSQLQIASAEIAKIAGQIAGLPFTDAALEAEREGYLSLLLENPNYFGNLDGSIFQPVKPIKSNTSYEELICVGLQPQLDRLEAVLQVKGPAGYGGGICAAGSHEFVRFFVDLHDNGIFHDVGVASVNVHDIPGAKPLCYSVYLDFTPIRKLCLFENIVKVRAVLSWNSVPPPNPNFVPVWGNRVDAEVQIRPRPFIILGDVLKEFDLAKVSLPDPVGPIIKSLDPETKLAPIAPQALNIAEKRKAYARLDVPVHRFAFQEVHALLENTNAPTEIFSAMKSSPLQDLGLTAKEIVGLVGKFAVKTDGDTSFEQLNCIGVRPVNDVIEGVLTVKKPAGYSGSLCGTGSTEYVAYWADFNDGTGFNYLGTASVQVHDLQSVPTSGVKYGVFTKANFSKWRVPCQFGARIGKLRAILSWGTPPPPANPNYVPVWGNRQECFIQLRPGTGTGHVALIETVGDVPVNHINQSTGLATGNLEIANTVSVNQSPFGGEVTITGELGLPPDVLGGGAQPFKYRVEVKRDDGIDTYHPLLNDIEVSVAEWISGVPQFCSLFNLVCQRTLHPTNDSDGFGDGWYPYLEDTTAPHTRHLVTSILGRWQTTAAMEGRWKIRVTAKNPNTSPATLLPGVQEVTVWIDNTAPVAGLSITGATFNGTPLTAVDCGKFPVGTIITGTYTAHDPGTASNAADFQHFGGLSFAVLPGAPAHGASVDPSARSFPVVPTIGEDGTWTLNTGAIPANPATGEPGRPAMDPCGYVIHLTVCDRTNVDSRGNAYCRAADVGFCLELPA